VECGEKETHLLTRRLAHTEARLLEAEVGPNPNHGKVKRRRPDSSRQRSFSVSRRK